LVPRAYLIVAAISWRRRVRNDAIAGASFDALDEEKDQQMPAERYGQTRRRRLLPFACLLVGVTVLSAGLGLIWRDLDLKSPFSITQSLRTFAAQLIPSQSSTGISSEQVLEIDALKKEIAQLRTVREQLIANIETLHLRRQELEQLSSIKVMYWYSEPTRLLYQNAAEQQPSTTETPTPTTLPNGSTKRKRSETQ
jgi:hypothetical protein